MRLKRETKHQDFSCVLTPGVHLKPSPFASIFGFDCRRVPDRINVTDAEGLDDPAQRWLVYALSASVVAVGAWLAVLIAKAVRSLGWKKVEVRGQSE